MIWMANITKRKKMGKCDKTRYKIEFEIQRKSKQFKS
jgi:hypothetical protein